MLSVLQITRLMDLLMAHFNLSPRLHQPLSYPPRTLPPPPPSSSPPPWLRMRNEQTGVGAAAAATADTDAKVKRAAAAARARAHVSPERRPGPRPAPANNLILSLPVIYYSASEAAPDCRPCRRGAGRRVPRGGCAPPHPPVTRRHLCAAAVTSR